MTSLINNLICCVYFPSYRSVAGPEVLQTEVVFVKVILCQVLHNHNIYTFNLSVMVETAPAGRQKKTHFKLLLLCEYNGTVWVTEDSLTPADGVDNTLLLQLLPGLFDATCFPESGILQQLCQFIQGDRLLKAVRQYRNPWQARGRSTLQHLIISLFSFESLSLLLSCVGAVFPFLCFALCNCGRLHVPANYIYTGRQTKNIFQFG